MCSEFSLQFRVNISRSCLPHKHYIGLIRSYPADIASYFTDKSSKKHANNFTEATLAIDGSNIDFFSKKHVQVLRHMKRMAKNMTVTYRLSNGLGSAV